MDLLSDVSDCRKVVKGDGPMGNAPFGRHNNEATSDTGSALHRWAVWLNPFMDLWGSSVPPTGTLNFIRRHRIQGFKFD